MKMNKNDQIVDIEENEPVCNVCGTELSLGAFTFLNVAENRPRIRLELNRCNNCGAEFLLRFRLFDQNGHIPPYVFSGDINDSSFEWQSIWTPEQQAAILAHMENCRECQTRRDDQALSDAWFGDIIHSSKQVKGRAIL